MNQQRRKFRIDCAVRAGVRTGFAADTAHIVPDQQFFLFLLFLKRLHGTGIDAMRLFAAAANKVICCQFSYGNNPVISGMIKITALDNALFTLTGRADIQVNKEPLILALLRLDI